MTSGKKHLTQSSILNSQSSLQFSSLRGTLRYNEPLARNTSWHVGGPARKTYRPADLEDLAEFLKTTVKEEPITWLGLGSNVLIRDGGIEGIVIITQGRLNKLELCDNTVIRVEAGVSCAKMSKFCVKQGFAGGAFFSGVPGTMGGVLAMNAGAFGGETWRNVVAVETIDRFGEIRLRKPADFVVNYRSVQKPAGEWFVAGHFSFAKEDPEKGAEAIKQLLRKRAATQPIGEFSCGSVFRNPTGDHAARLIETAGLKGLRLGDAWVSEKHANFIINGGHATAANIEKLILMVQEQVEKIHGVKLITEVHIIGEFA